MTENSSVQEESNVAYFRTEHKNLLERLKEIKIALNTVFAAYEDPKNTGKQGELSATIGKLKSEKRVVKAQLDRLVETVFGIIDKSDELTDISQIALEKIRTNNLRDKLALRELELNALDNLEIKLRQDCMQATLKEAWGETVFPFFNAISTLTDDDPVALLKAKYYASLAISQHQTLKALLLDETDAVELDLPLWTGNDELQVNNETTQVLIKRTKEQHAKRMEAYSTLKEEMSDLRRKTNWEETAPSISLKKTEKALVRSVKTKPKILVKKKRTF